MNTVHQLRTDGYKVRCLHYRRSTEWVMTTRHLSKMASNYWKKKMPELYHPLIASYQLTNDQMMPNGGMTIVQITDPKGKAGEGHSYCDNTDSYDRKMGVRIALGRALAAIKEGTPVPSGLTELLYQEHETGIKGEQAS